MTGYDEVFEYTLWDNTDAFALTCVILSEILTDNALSFSAWHADVKVLYLSLLFIYRSMCCCIYALLTLAPGWCTSRIIPCPATTLAFGSGCARLSGRECSYVSGAFNRWFTAMMWTGDSCQDFRADRSKNLVSCTMLWILTMFLTISICSSNLRCMFRYDQQIAIPSINF